MQLLWMYRTSNTIKQQNFQLNSNTTKEIHDIKTLKIFNENLIYSFNSEFTKRNKYLNSNYSSAWIIDSGATIHMCHTNSYLGNFSSHEGHNVIISIYSKKNSLLVKLTTLRTFSI